MNFYAEIRAASVSHTEELVGVQKENVSETSYTEINKNSIGCFY